MKLSELGFRSGLELGPSPGFMCPHLLAVRPPPGAAVPYDFDNTQGKDMASEEAAITGHCISTPHTPLSSELRH